MTTAEYYLLLSLKCRGISSGLVSTILGRCGAAENDLTTLLTAGLAELAGGRYLLTAWGRRELKKATSQYVYSALGAGDKGATIMAKTNSNGTRDGSKVGHLAKSAQDCPWTALKVEFYKALKRTGGSGTSAQIAEASKGKINPGHARHFGYHGVGGGLVKLDEQENIRGFVFSLTTKGRKIDPDAELAKAQKAKEAQKAAATA